MNINSETSTTSAAMPALDTEYSLSAADHDAFEHDGYVLLRGVLSAHEVPPCRETIGAVAEEFARDVAPLSERDSYGQAFLQIGNLWERSEACRKFTLARRFGKIAADLMGVDGVRLWHDQALFKEPGGGPTHWHQDHHYWPIDRDMIVMWMPLVDMTPDMGAMMFAAGSQREGHIAQMSITEESEQFFQEHVEKKDYRLASPGAMAAGDATFHDAWTLHKALGNDTVNMREVMTILYLPDGARVTEPQNEEQANDLRQWLPGCKPGDLAASPLNPVIYRR